MTDETVMDAWQREMIEGTPFKVRVHRIWNDHKLLLLAWAFVLLTSNLMAGYYGWFFIQAFWLVLGVTTIARFIEVKSQRSNYNNMMGVVAEIHKCEVDKNAK